MSAEDLERIVAERYASLYRFALSLVHNETEAADLTQQAFYRLASRGDQVRDLGRVKSWLYTTLYREFLALKRHSNRFVSEQPEMAAESPTLDADAVDRADATLVMEALQRVNETFRVPLALFYIDDLTYREIAEILNVPIGTVMSRLSRGKAELRALLAVALENQTDTTKIVPMPRKASGD